MLFGEALEAARIIGLRDHYIYALDGLAAASAEDDPTRGARLQGVSDAIAEQLGYSRHLIDEDQIRRRTLDSLRAASAEDEYQEALVHTRRMSPDDAVAYALEEPELG
jgi:hypothetical protein